MRYTLMASAALLGLALAAPAFAQTTNTQSTAPTPPAATTPMTGQAPAMGQTGQDQSTQTTAPAPGGTMSDNNGATATPMKPQHMHARMTGHTEDASVALGPDATPEQYLTEAQDMLKRHRPVQAEHALEFAETRMLDRATAPDMANQPDNAPRIRRIAAARDAIRQRDWQTANQAIDDALKHANMAESGGMSNDSGMNGGGMTGSSGAGGGAMTGGTSGSMNSGAGGNGMTTGVGGNSMGTGTGGTGSAPMPQTAPGTTTP